MNVLNPTTVDGVAYATNSAFDALGTRETMALTQPGGAGGTAPVSVAGNDGKVLVVPVMPGNQFYMTAPNGPGTETHWDLYARPYYRCRIRIIVSGTNSTLIYNPTAIPQMNAATTAGAISVKVIVLPDTSSKPDQILGFPDSAATTTTVFTNLFRRPGRNSAILDGIYQHWNYAGPQHPGDQCRREWWPLLAIQQYWLLSFTRSMSAPIQRPNL